MLEKVSEQFNSLFSAIEYYLTQQPTRQKSQSLEPVGGCKPSHSEFDRRHPARKWAVLSIGFSRVFKSLNALEQYAFRYWLKRYPPAWGIPDIAKYHGVGTRDLARAKKFVRETLEDELMDIGLMPFPDNWEPAKRDNYSYKARAGRPRAS